MKRINLIVIGITLVVMLVRLGLWTTGIVILSAGTFGFVGAWLHDNRRCWRERLDHKLACATARVRYRLDPTPRPTADEMQAWAETVPMKHYKRGVITDKDLARSCRCAA